MKNTNFNMRGDFYMRSKKYGKKALLSSITKEVVGNAMAETTLRDIGTAIKEEKKQHKLIFDITKVGCEHRKIHALFGEPIVYICGAPGTRFGELCCMRNCYYINKRILN